MSLPTEPDFYHYSAPAAAAAAAAAGGGIANEAPATTATNFQAENGNNCQPCSSSSTTAIAAAERDSTSPPEKKDEDDKGQEEATFPQQLMDLIEEETNNGAVTEDGERVVEWLPAGESFVIRDKKLFEKRVLPRHFSAKCKFMSFVRKLYRWGFRQVEKSIARVMIFTHANFVRGDKKRCLKMRSVVRKHPAKQRAIPPFANLGGMAGMGAPEAPGIRSHGGPVRHVEWRKWHDEPEQYLGGMGGIGGAGGMGAPGLQGLASMASQYGTMGDSKSGLQGFGPMAGEYNLMNGTNGMMGQNNMMGLNQFPHQGLGSQMYSSSFNQGGGGDGDGLIDSMKPMNSMNPGLMNSMNSMNPGLVNSMNPMNPNGIGFGGGSSLPSSMPNHFAGGSGMGGPGGLGGMNSADMFEARLRLREMEQAEPAPPMPFNSYPNGNLGNGSGNGMGGDGMSEVELASEIMKRGDPGMEPWRALEMARRFNGAI